MTDRAAAEGQPEQRALTPRDAATAPRARRRALLGLLFVAGYVLPLFVPPGPEALLPFWHPAPLFTRLFPTVPAWWVLSRLSCLVVGAVLIAGAVKRSAPVHVLRIKRHTRSEWPGPSRSATAVALLIAVAHALLTLRVAQLTRPQQVGYFAMLGAPTALLWLSARWRALRTASGASPSHRRNRRTVLAVALVLAIWGAWRIPAALHSPRAATPIDMWLNFQWLFEAAADNRNILTSSSQPGVVNTYLLFLGLPLFGAGKLTPSFTWVQAFHTVWILATGAALGLLAAVTAGRAAAPLAVATLLFSPLLLMVHLGPAPFGLLMLLTVALLLLTRRLYVDASVTGLAALGAVAGFSASLPYLTHFSVAAGVATAVRACRKPRLPWPGLVIAAATFFAATVPALPRVSTLRAMMDEYVQRHWQWAGGEAVLLGQRSPRRHPSMVALTSLGRAAPYEVPLGGILMPFMVPRTGLRLCGDVLFEPIGAALAAIGLAACLRRPSRRGAAAMLVVYGLALLPAAASRETDRVSMTRSIGTPIAVALLAAMGFQTLRRALFSRRRASLACTATVAGSMVAGAVIFDIVTPRLIAASALDIILQAARNVPDPGRVMVLEQVEPFVPPHGWLHVHRIATYLPARPFPTWTFEGPDQPCRPGVMCVQNVLPPATEPVPDLFFWSPGLEEDTQASRQICARWPGAALYILQDRAALSRAFAASPTGPHWRPALPDEHWEVGGCDALAGQLRGLY